MGEAWHRRVGYALHRRWRILQGIGRFYGGKLRDGLRLGRERLARAATALLLLLAVGATAWSLTGGLIPPVGPARGDHLAGGGPEVTPSDQSPPSQAASRPSAAMPAPADARVDTGSPFGEDGGGAVATAGRAGALGQPAVPGEAVARPGVPEPGAERPRVVPAGLPLPVEGNVLAGPGWRRHPVLGHWHYDPGAQLAAAPGSPVRAVLPGTVAEAGPDPAGGLRVAVDHGDGLITVYGRLEHVVPAVGQSVSAHAPLGYAARGPGEAPVGFAVYMNGEPIDPATVLAAP